MFRPRVIPCLLLSDAGLVKTRQFADPVYVGDPINAVRIFNDARADELIFLDIQASRQGRSVSPRVVRAISDEAFMPFAVGGGLDTTDKIRSMFDAGTEKVVLNSAAHHNPSLISEAAGIFGNQAIVVAVDVVLDHGEYRVCTHSGTRILDRSLEECIRIAESSGAGEIFINAIHRDGTRGGFDTSLIRLVSGMCRIPVIACGGAGSYSDFPVAIEAGASAVAAGSVFVFMGRKSAVLINYPEKDELLELFSTP